MVVSKHSGYDPYNSAELFVHREAVKLRNARALDQHREIVGKLSPWIAAMVRTLTPREIAAAKLLGEKILGI